MEGGPTSVTRRQLETGELVGVFLRLAILVCLGVLYAVTSRTGPLGSPRTLIVAAVVVAAVGYCVLVLQLLARSALPPVLADVSALLDSLSVAVFFWLALSAPDGVPIPTLAVAAIVAWAFGAAGTLLRLAPRCAFLYSGGALAGCAAVMLPALLGGRAPGPWVPWIGAPAGILVVGSAICWVAVTLRRLVDRNLATGDQARASRRLRMTMEIVQVSIANLGQYVADLERVSATLLEGAHNQQRSIERVSSSITALNASQEQISRSTEKSAQTIRLTVDSADTGNRVVKRVIEEIQSISDAVDRMVSSLELIDDIADNTNLLALNANIEANRGGSESMGFSVVADEIRNLAEQSQATALEVGRLVKQIAKVIFTAGASSKHSGEVFDKINSDLAGYAEYVNGLHLSVQEQLKANREVQRAITRINEVTLNNTKAADRVGTTVADLQREVSKLKALLEGKVPQRSVGA